MPATFGGTASVASHVKVVTWLVAEPLARDLLLRLRQPEEDVGQEIGSVLLDSGWGLQQGIGTVDHHASVATRIPENCHRASGGKKLR
jgi:hypothetical protein